MEKIYVSIYNEDSFRGISVPCEFKGLIDYISKNTFNVIDNVFTDYVKYRDYEVEMLHYSKDPSNGTKEIVNVYKFIDYFKPDDKIVKLIKDYVDILNYESGLGVSNWVNC